MSYKVPEKIKLLIPGDNDSTKGKCRYTPEMQDMLNDIFKKHGPYCWDRDHSMLVDNTSTDDKISMGWSTLIANDEGVFAINNEWNDIGESFIKEGKYRKFSLACTVDEEENLDEVINISLCNLSADPQAWLSDDLRTRSITVNDLKKDNMKRKKEIVELESQEIVKRSEEVEDEKEETRSEETESSDKEEVVEEREESQEEQEVEDKKFQELSDKIAALESLVAELSDEIQRKRSEEQKVEDEKEMEEKRSLLQNRSESVKKYYMTRPLSEVKAVLRAFIKNEDKVIPSAKKQALIEEKQETPVKKVIWNTSGKGFGIPR